MHIHILGICGTFMGSLAQLAKASGHQVSGSDTNIYPPMSTQLEKAGIALTEGYDTSQFISSPDLVVIGNALSRGNPAVEYVLNNKLDYTSGPQWLCEHLLKDKWVLAVAGTHGKTTTSSMLAWILEYADMRPGFLIGGVPANFNVSARLGDSQFFVVEADEYDTAFFDKRSKFLHYRPRTTILNNLEFDHADIFDDIDAIQIQFHHFVRTVPSKGLIITPSDDANIQATIDRGCWSEVQCLGEGGDWNILLAEKDSSAFSVIFQGDSQGTVRWEQVGIHNAKNGLAAIAAANHVGVKPQVACEALCQFLGVKRRMEKIATVSGVTVYDDFAHHPTAIFTTLEGIRDKVGDEKIVAVIEPRSNTMKLGVHKDRLAEATRLADQVLWYQPESAGWSLAEVVNKSSNSVDIIDNIDELIQQTLNSADGLTHIVIMSNGGFSGFHSQLVHALKEKNDNKQE
ncbi:MAG: UDP-N-acetylmuramate: L-alanyl-gamma-D-glutamyl-meso-diaminopimelate ligase [Porticoccus sp.]|jgi:UDP-N-acetylmuramate: L-alanyl-gamma-D-glutamyl-meso-diaminopimelate ligase